MNDYSDWPGLERGKHLTVSVRGFEHTPQSRPEKTAPGRLGERAVMCAILYIADTNIWALSSRLIGCVHPSPTSQHKDRQTGGWKPPVFSSQQANAAEPADVPEWFTVLAALAVAVGAAFAFAG